MFKSFTVGRIFGIPIKFDVTFLVILPIFAWIIGIQVAELVFLLNEAFGTGIDADRLTVGNWPWVLGAFAAVGLFVGVVLHELGHSVVAIRYGYGIDSITLWLLGGLASLVEQPRDWRHEFWIAIAGPVVSVVLGLICALVLFVIPTSFDAARFVVAYLALMNVVLAAFNMLPGFPMDGGRVLRALLARTRPFAQATQMAAEVGKGFAFVLGLFGLLAFNVILIALAFFIYIAASGEAKRTVLESAFEDVTVRDVMTPASEVKVVPPEATVASLLERMFSQRHTGYPVVDDERLVGVVTFDDVRDVSPDERGTVLVSDVMTSEIETIAPDADALDALLGMSRSDVGRLLVVDDRGDLAGLVSRTDLMRAFTIISQTKSFDVPRRFDAGHGVISVERPGHR